MLFVNKTIRGIIRMKRNVILLLLFATNLFYPENGGALKINEIIWKILQEKRCTMTSDAFIHLRVPIKKKNVYIFY